MKKILFVFALMLLATVGAYSQVVSYVSGNEEDFMARAAAFVDQTKKICDNYSDSDWSLSLKQFDMYDDEFDDIEDKLSEDDQKEFKRLKGAYAGLVAHYTPKIVGTKAKKVYEQNIKPFLEGVYETIK